MHPNRYFALFRSRSVLRVAATLVTSFLVFAGSAGALDPPPITLQELAALEGGDAKLVLDAASLRVVGVELPSAAGASAGDAETVVLSLDRIAVFAPDAEIVVHAAGGERIEAPPENLYFAGAVEDRPGSRAVLTLDADGGLRAIVTDGGGWWRIGSVPGEAAGMEKGTETVVTRKVEASAEPQPFLCANDSHDLSRPASALPVPKAEPGIRRLAEPTATGVAVVPEKAASYTARIAFETDEAFLADFGGDTTAAADYVGDMVAFASSVYADEVETSWLVETVSLWEVADPWSESGAFCRLLEFGQYWNDNRGDVDRTVAHFLAGGGSRSGIAWIGVLCSGDFAWDSAGLGCSFSDMSNYGGGYGYTGGLVGNFDVSSPSPIWDIVALMHEIGHNFNSPHTHCYEGIGGSSSPVDRCYNFEGIGDDGIPGTIDDNDTQCWSGAEALPADCPGFGNNCGTIMSYCHLISGGNGISGEIALALGEGFAYGTLPGRVPDRMSSHVSFEAGGHPGCLDFTVASEIFTDGFESGDVSAWSASVP